MTKRMLSLVMVVAMVLTLFAGLTLTTHAADGTYTQVTDASTLAAGDTILLAKADSSAYAGAMGSSAFFNSVASQADAIEITLSGDSTGWTFTTSEGTVGTTAAKKMNSAGNGTTTWTISIDSDGLATIASTNSSCGKILYNNTSPRFLNYTSSVSSSMQLPIIYKKDGGGSTGGHTHEWGEWTSNNDGTHSRTCADPEGDCPNPTETADCTYGDPVVVPATCSDTGSSTKTCTVCGYSLVTTLAIDPDAHTDGDGDGVCDDCGEDMPNEITGDIVFADLGLENSVQYSDPFTSSNGQFTVQFGAGANDGKYYTTGSGIRVYQNGYMKVSAVSGTITKIVITCAGANYQFANTDADSGSFDGSTWTGSAAEVTFTRAASGQCRIQSVSVTVAANGSVHVHDWGEWYSNNDGTHSRDCNDCGDTETADCTYGDPVVVPATCSATGTSTETCTVCGYANVTTLAIDPDAHTDSDNDGVCDDCGEDMPTQPSELTGDIVFADLGLENSVAYTDPFTSDNGAFTVQFGGGGNNGKYYTTGTGIRVYGGGTMTVASSVGTITSIVITCNSGYVIVADTSDVGTLTVDGTTGTWTGSANSVTFTRASGSGHWRIQAVSVTVATSGNIHVHSWGEWYTNNDGTHSRDCDDPDGDCPDPTETANCTYGDITVVTPATCSSVGSGTHTCTVCGYTETVEIPVDANAHDWEWDGNEGANGTHGTVCNECGATGTEACVDTDDDDVCDVCGADMPAVVTYTLSDELHDGDKVVIYHPTSGKAISINASGTKLAAVDVAPSNGALVVEDTNVAIFTVAFVDDTNFTLVDQNGNYLTSGQTGNALSLGAESDTLSQWYLSTLGSSKVGIRSTGANYNGNYNQALEYYNGFTTYGWKDNNNAYIFELYTVVNQQAHVHDWDQGTITTAATCEAEGVMTYECTDCGETKTEPIPMIAHVDANSDGVCDSCGGTIYAKATMLNNGDQVVIYNPASGMAMTKNASGTRLAGLATNAQGGVAVKSDSDLAVLTVQFSGNDFYLVDADGKYLTTAETGNALTLEETATDYSLWYLSSDETGITIINKNALYNEKQIAIEFYGSNFTGYSMSAAGDAFYMELYTIAAPAVSFSGASLSMNDAIEINFYVDGVTAANAALYTVDLTGPSGSITGAALQHPANGYRVSYPVYAKDYGATVTATLKMGDTTIATGTYSVQTYLTSQENAGDQKLVALIKAAEDFGFYAADNFGTDANIIEPNNDLSDIDASTLANYAASADSLDDLDPADGVNFYGASLLLEEKTTLRFWFRIADDNAAGNYSAVIGDTTYDLTRSGNTKYYYFDVTGIVAKDLDKAVDFTLMNGDTAVLRLTGYSPLTYCQQVLKNGPAETQNLCRALYKYWEAANTYFGLDS